MSLTKKSLEAELYRVGRAADPWAWPDWAYADGTFDHRWDDANGRYRVLYASSQRLGCFLETLVDFRPDPGILAEYALQEADTRASGTTATPGVVPRDWFHRRVITRGVMTEACGWFVVVGDAETLSELRTALAARVVHYGLRDLDAATIRLSTPRAFTQEISSYIATQRDENGRPYAGIYYCSRLDDGVENWAVFEQQSMGGRSPVFGIATDPIDSQDGDLQRALALLGLRLEGA